VICPNVVCGADVAGSAKFCPECGTRLGSAGPSQGVSTGGGSISGGVYQAAGDIHVGGTPQNPVAQYEPKWSWQSPLTLALLTWVSVGLGVLGVIAGWQGFAPLFVSLRHGLPAESPQPGWMIALMVALLLIAVAIWLRRVAKNRTQHFAPVSWLPTLTGWGGRIGLARLQGNCPICGGRFRFYDKPSRWIDYEETGRRKVIERRMAAECVKNADHWWPVDKTDGGQD
jgi:hypothetical protein